MLISTVSIICILTLGANSSRWPTAIPPSPTSPEHQIAAQSTSGAVFSRVGAVYTGLAYGHLVMNYNLTSITHRTQQLEEIRKFANDIVIPEKATVSDRYFLNWTKSWMNEEIQETIEKLDEALHPIRYPNQRRRKRQLIVGLASAAIGAIAGSIISEFSTDGVNDVIENKQNVLVATVKDNLIRLNQDTRDIKNLKETMKFIINDMQKYIIDAKRNTYGVTHLQTMITVQQTCRSLIDAINTIESASIGEFLPSMVDHQGLSKALKQLRGQAVRKGYELSIETSMDMKHLPCTSVVKGDTLHVIIHIPLYQPALDLDLFRYVDHPIQKMDDGLFASIDLEGRPTFLAINRDETRYKEFSAGDLEACYRRNKRYFCPDIPLYSKTRENCLWGLYKNQETHIKQNCHITLSRMVAKAVRVDQDRFMVTDTDNKNELTLTCGNNVPIRDKINGTQMIHVAKGCRASTAHITIDHPLYEPEVVIEGLVINDEVSFKSWIPQNQTQHFIETAKEILNNVGQKAAWSEIATLTAFNAKMAAASVTLPHFGGGFFGWIARTITPVLGVAFCILVIYLIIRCLPTCQKLYAKRKEKRAARALNPNPKFRYNAKDVVEPMEVDQLQPYEDMEVDYNPDPIIHNIYQEGPRRTPSQR